MHILLFGGSFNPPHLGHLVVIEQAFELIPNLDEIWLLPCYNHTFNKSLAPAADRLAMCNLLVNELTSQHVNLVKVCTVEIDHHSSGSTYETLNLLKKDPAYNIQNTTYSFLIGSDQLPVFNKWQHWEKLLKEMPFYVYPRAGYPMEPLYPGMTALKSPTQVITNISSTLIRDRLTKQLTTTSVIPKKIVTYIKQHKLYEKSG